MVKTLKENGKRSGKILLETYGAEHFAKMGKSSIAKQKERDPDIFKKRGKAGALARQKKDPRYLERMRAARWGKKLREKTALDVLLGKK